MTAELKRSSEGQTLVLTLSNPERRNALGPDIYTEGIEALNRAENSPDVRTFPKPVIAAVEGVAAGAGFSLALACDFIVAADSAVFVMAYSNIALSPDGGASWSLTRALPRQLVTELLMCGERIPTQRLHDLGLINRVTHPGNAFAEALRLAAHLNERAPNALASIKTLINESPHASLVDQLGRERDHFVRNLHHANAGIGISAFLAKKPPDFH